MATDNLAHLLTVMTVVGLWAKSEWSERVKFLYHLYSRVVDSCMFVYLVTKMINTYNGRNCDKILQELFEASYLVVIFMQRMGLSNERFSDLVNMLQEMQTTAEIKGEIAKRYNTWEKRISTMFALSTAFGLFQLFFLQKPPEYCAGQDGDKSDLSRRLIIEIWLPFDETKSPHWEFTDTLLKVLVVMTATRLYLFSILVPLFVLEACCHFRIVAYLLRENLIYKKGELAQGKVRLESVIRYHQKVLHFSRQLSKCFQNIMAFKLLFLVIPMVVAVFAFSKQIGQRKIAMGHFMVQMFVELFIYCWFGEQFTAHSEMVSEAAYDTQWLDLNMKDRKHVMLMMRMSQQPIKLQYISASKSAADLNTFIGICQFAYSLYTLMGVLSQRTM